MKRLLVFLSLIPVLYSCSSQDEESEILDEISATDGEVYWCRKQQEVEYNKIDWMFCGVDEGLIPGMRIWKRKEGHECKRCIYDHGREVSCEELRNYVHIYWDQPTMDCTNHE